MGLRPRNLREAGLFPEERDTAWIVRILHGKAMPVFLAGSAHMGTFLVTRFVNGKMYTWVMQADQFNGGQLRVLYNGNAYVAASTPGKRATRSASC